MKIKFRNVDTGEIIEIDEDDFDAFDECMFHTVFCRQRTDLFRV